MTEHTDLVEKLRESKSVGLGELTEQERSLLREVCMDVELRMPWQKGYHEYVVLRHEFEDVAYGQRDEISLAFEKFAPADHEDRCGALLRPSFPLKNFTIPLRLYALRHSDLFDITYNT